MRNIELLVPASSLEVLKIAVVFGADAVYIGGEAFGLRAKAKNFSHEDMAEGIAFAHEHGVKVYVTVNILAHNDDLPGVREYLQELKELKPDALIIADPGIFTYAREICPEIECHISTQANNTNYETYRFWYKLGAKSVRSVNIFRMIWKSRLLFMEQCVFLIPEDACLAIIWLEEMRIRGHAHIRVVGNILLWKKNVLVNICRYLRMREELISSTPRISVW